MLKKHEISWKESRPCAPSQKPSQKPTQETFVSKAIAKDAYGAMHIVVRARNASEETRSKS